MPATYDQPPWVTPNRPRWIRDWRPTTTVFVTNWGDRVHLYPDCPGTKAYGSNGTVRKAQLNDRICAARSGCLKCFGEFFGESSLRDLVRLIDRLHGVIDEDQPARAVIAAKARMRFGSGKTGPPTKSRSKRKGEKASAPSPTAPSAGGLVRSFGYGKPRRKPAASGAPPRSRSPKALVSKPQTKRERTRAEAAKLGITVEELKARRRATHQANVAKKRRRPE